MKSFGKKSNCPTTQTVLSYVEGSLHPLTGEQVGAHAAACDFCGAEMQLLAKYTPTEADYTPVPAAPAINALSVILNQRHPAADYSRRAA